jgi:hypothetical protein
MFYEKIDIFFTVDYFINDDKFVKNVPFIFYLDDIILILILFSNFKQN